MRWLLALLVLVWGFGVGASELHLEGDLVQGGLVRGQVAPGSAVTFDGRALRVSPDGWFVFGFGRDAPDAVELVVRDPDGHEVRRRLEVGARDYEIERIDGLPPRKVTPSEEDLAQIQADAKRLKAAKALDSDGVGFAETVAWPATGPISGVYGSQRVLNGEPRSPHRGVDVAAPAGTPVGAMAGAWCRLPRPGCTTPAAR